MGLIKAVAGAVGGTLADQWLEYFYCDSLDARTLAVKGQKRTSGRSSNTRGEDNVITNGSGIAVNDGQVAIIVANGEVVEVCAEPGKYTYDTSTEPTFLRGDLGDGVKAAFDTAVERFRHGGIPANDQRVYYFNTKEIIGNKFGTATPVPFRVVDNNIGLDMDVSVRCNGEYSYKLVDPVLFYKNVCGNISEPYTRDRLDSQLKSEFLTALQPAFAKISALGVRYSAIPAHAMELADAMDEQLSHKWTDLRGLDIASVGVNSVAISPEDEKAIKDLQKSATMRDASMRDAALAGATADAMRSAAANESGAMTGFMGMNMAQGVGIGTMQGYAQAPGSLPPNQYATAAGGGYDTSANAWACPKCGHQNTGKFCNECGAPKPAPAPVEGQWKCEKCGTLNSGKFCSECGAPKPAPKPTEWTCPTCGSTNKGKFCSQCGTPRP